MREALIVIDVQQAFDDMAYWSATDRRHNPAFEDNVAQLIDIYAKRRDPIVVVSHDSLIEDSPLHPSSPGNALMDCVHATPDLEVRKTVHSAFLGDQSLSAWLAREEIGKIAVCGIQTNICCETTTRHGCDLGYDVRFVVDATRTFDARRADGTVLEAELLAEVTTANLDGEFASVCRVADLV